MIEHTARMNVGPELDYDLDPSVTRGVVFMLLGPMLIAFAIWLLLVSTGGPCIGGFAMFCAGLFFLFACAVAVVAKLVDTGLARVPKPLRAFLTAIIVAAIAVGLILVSIGMMLPMWILSPFVITSAYCAGLCSLLSGASSR